MKFGLVVYTLGNCHCLRGYFTIVGDDAAELLVGLGEGWGYCVYVDWYNV